MLIGLQSEKKWQASILRGNKSTMRHHTLSP